MFYDSFRSRSKTPLGTALYRRRFDTILSRMLLESNARSSCLEIGPGEGWFAQACRARRIDYRAVERNVASANNLRRAGFEIVTGGVPPVPFESSQFDMVGMFTVLEHMPTFEQAFEALKECGRVLRPGGTLAVEAPDFIRGGTNFYAWDYTHSYLTTEVRLEQILRDSGFEVVRIVPFCGSLTSAFLRIPIDLAGFVVHSRLVHWLFSLLGLRGALCSYHKTFEPSLLIIARKTLHEPATPEGSVNH